MIEEKIHPNNEVVVELVNSIQSAYPSWDPSNLINSLVQSEVDIREAKEINDYLDLDTSFEPEITDNLNFRLLLAEFNFNEYIADVISHTNKIKLEDLDIEKASKKFNKGAQYALEVIDELVDILKNNHNLILSRSDITNAIIKDYFVVIEASSLENRLFKTLNSELTSVKVTPRKANTIFEQILCFTALREDRKNMPISVYRNYYTSSHEPLGQAMIKTNTIRINYKNLLITRLGAALGLGFSSFSTAMAISYPEDNTYFKFAGYSLMLSLIAILVSIKESNSIRPTRTHEIVHILDQRIKEM